MRGMSFRTPGVALELQVGVCCIFYFLLMLPFASSLNNSTAFFNSTLNSSVTIRNNILTFQSNTFQRAFSFKTCYNGQLIYQRGQSGDEFSVILINGSINIRWKSGNSEIAMTTNAQLNNNAWYIMDLRNRLGVITMEILRGRQRECLIYLANSTYQSSLLGIDLSGSEGLVIGRDFTGCVQEGPGVTFINNANVRDVEVEWSFDTCPLDGITCNSDEVPQRICWQQPCKNSGVCVDDANGYTCQCPYLFNGTNCENDLRQYGCSISPCLNGGTCQSLTSGSRTYRCNCVPGFTGENCETNIDECGPKPCANDVDCIDGLNSYYCNCTGSGFRGVHCDVDINECEQTPDICGNGTCFNYAGDFRCECPVGFEGFQCLVPTDDCASSPCRNGATCVDGVGGYTCQCVLGYTGTQCQTDADNCAGIDCSTSGAHRVCKDGLNSYTCACKDGYSETSGNCVDIDECASSPCRNGATCQNLENAYRCVCAAGYMGPQCESNIDECATQPCQNGATCQDRVNDYLCVCPAGYEGKNCSANIDDCVTNGQPCKNGATCTDKINDYSCHCAPGWTKKNCTVDYDECTSQPCRNGGTCRDKLNAYNCTCTPGWTGTQCTVDINECQSQPCLNGATCHNLPNAYNCTCAPGFTGSNCQTNIDDCQPNPCQNGGTCVDGVNGYNCTCTPTFMGKNCSKLYNACESFQPCMNGATCNPVLGTQNYSCNCVLGFTDANCSTNIDDCLPSACTLPLVCYDLIHDYKCACPIGKEGTDCAQDIDECLSSPCQNGGTCHNEEGRYRCECQQVTVNLTKYGNGQKLEFLSGFKGDNCEVDINECDYSSPSICLHNGSCANTHGDYNCFCGSVYDGVYATGNNCELSTSYCESANEVKGDPPACHNGGTCLPDENSFTCSCAPGFTDPRCKTNINECESSPCQYGGTCVDGIARYECVCIPGITGPNCETDIDECLSMPCQNGGMCIDHINGYECNCTDTGFNGTNCELNIDDCAPGPCQNEATCTDLIKDYNCTCYDGYLGKDCQEDINECESSPCQYNGTCLERSKPSTYQTVPSLGNFAFAKAAGYYCDCIPGITGVNCETDIDDCVNNTCLHGSTCQDRINYYNCECAPGYRGQRCEIDIDECLEQKPCQNGATCIDKVADFECRCAPGYRGRNCEIEIDECKEYSPCQNNATCTDKVADYQCSCSEQPDADNRVFSGKNCTVQLTACIGNENCTNGATCVPFLKFELQTIQQAYYCKCAPGFTGDRCHINTTFSFTGISSVERTLSQVTNNTIKFRFRTTLPDVILLMWSGQYFSTGIFMHIELFNGSLYMSYVKYNPIFSLEQVNVQIPVQINDGKWQEIHIDQFNDTEINEKGIIILKLISPECGNDICEKRVEYLHMANTQPTTELFFGNIGDKLPKLSFTKSQTLFKGCMQDMTVNNKVVTAVNNDENIPKNIWPGCVRNQQCFPNTCSRRGTCTDMWDNFECNCNRRYLGTKCQEEFVPATFSMNNVASSSAIFTVPPNQMQEIRSTVKMSLFIRTREPSGLIMYLGNNNTTFLTLEMYQGKLASRLVLCDFQTITYILDNSTVINDGQQHFVGVEFQAGQKLRLLRNGNVVRSNTLPSSGGCSLNASHLIFGGEIPQSLRQTGRVRRNTDVVIADGNSVPKLTELGNFKGTIQDAELNDNKLVFFPGNTSVESNFTLTSLTEVEANEVSDDICDIQSPCMHNGTCTNVFFNDFRCDCPRGFRGKTCSEIDFCDFDSCPSTATCNSLHNGFECISTALFNNTSQVEYVHKLNPGRTIKDISIQMRTLVKNGLILFAQNGAHVLKIRIRGSKLQVLYQVGNGEVEIEEADYDVSDRELHTVTLTENLTNMTLAITGPHRNISKDFTFRHSPTVNLTALITNEESNKKLRLGFYQGAMEDWFYKGCLKEVRIAGILLPFYVISDFTNYNTSIYLEYFEAVAVSVEKHRCSTEGSCANSQCKHSSMCQEDYYSYNCQCPAGYGGKWCENNINDCATPTVCGQGGKCVDGVNSFTCRCSGGYSGARCQNHTDPCVPNPCLNGAVCSDDGGSAACNCTSGFVGNTCGTPITQTCSDNPCKNNATCQPGTGGQPSFNCSCLSEYTGTLCDEPKNLCSDLPCQNGGNCTNDYTGNTFICSCPAGYGGKNCSENIDDCSTNPCQNSGVCIDLVGDHVCNCTEGWNGASCEVDVNECQHQPCQRGECVNTPGSYHCNCVGNGTGYTGPDCGIDYDECKEESPCENGATCLNYEGGYNCSCTEGYKGKNCTVVDCASVVCLNGGQCTHAQVDNTWQCDCPKYVHGVKCETLGPCYSEPCDENNTESNCKENSNLTDYTCTCKTEWQGKNCSEDVDECSSSSPPCHPDHTYNCTNAQGDYICYCHPGFSDKNCFTNINECSSVTCHNGGTCIDGINSYTCNCTSGWTNTSNCMEDINECTLQDPCLNGATCVNTEGSFSCQCEPGFIGNLCATKDPDFRKISSDDNVWIIVGPVVAGFLLLVVIGVIIFLKMARKKRRTRGTYNPSRQEMNGSKLELGRVLKPPPEERLI